jgi:hypothetical protein
MKVFREESAGYGSIEATTSFTMRPSGDRNRAYVALPTSHYPDIILDDQRGKIRPSYRLVALVSLTLATIMLVSMVAWSHRPSAAQMMSSGSLLVPYIDYDKASRSYSLYDSSSKELLAIGSYEKDVNGSGWNYMRVSATDIPIPSRNTKTYRDEVEISNQLVDAYISRMRALGHLEGYMTCKEISLYYLNFYSGLFDGGDPTDEALDFLQKNYDWMKSLAEKHWAYSEHWLAVRGFLAQLDGLVSGQNQGCPGSDGPSRHSSAAFLPTLKRRPATIHFLLMNGLGDLYQIAEKFNQRNQPPSDILPDSYFTFNDLDFDQAFIPKSRRESPETSRRRTAGVRAKGAPAPDWRSKHQSRDHCSSIIKLLPDKSDIVFGHNTWDDYQMMGPRIIKYVSSPLLTPHRDGDDYDHYIYHTQLDASSSNQLKHEVYFTSSPGLLTSVDDFYTMSGRANLAVTETS